MPVSLSEVAPRGLQAAPVPTDDQTERGTQLFHAAQRIRTRDIGLVHGVGLGHIGGEFSAIDVLTTLYVGGVLRVDPADPTNIDRDRFILSKGHSACALYCTLSAAGFLPDGELDTFMQPLSRLSGHPDRRKVAGVETNTGPLGHGFPVAVGAALAARLRGSDSRTWVLCGDGELQEGSMWEAAMSASQFQLANLTLIVDRNRLQQGARTEDTIALDPLDERFRSFGWQVFEVDGHNHAGLLALFEALRATNVGGVGQPTCVIANTKKGNGVSFIADNVAWHHRVPNDAELANAIDELSAGVA